MFEFIRWCFSNWWSFLEFIILLIIVLLFVLALVYAISGIRKVE